MTALHRAVRPRTAMMMLFFAVALGAVGGGTIRAEDDDEPAAQAEPVQQAEPEPPAHEEPAQQAEPEQPAHEEPAQQAEPEQPAHEEPAQHAEPQPPAVEEPAEPEHSAEPERPVEPEQKAEPGQPAEPEEKAEPEQPVEPKQKAEPKPPVEPEQKAEPGQPAEPEEKAEPEQPVEPEQKAEPNPPVEPEQKAEPEQPAAPEEKAEPEHPAEPEQKAEPGAPVDGDPGQELAVCSDEFKECPDGSPMPRDDATCAWQADQCPAKTAEGADPVVEDDGTKAGLVPPGEEDAAQVDDPEVVDNELPALPQEVAVAPAAVDLCDPDDVRICPDGSSVRPEGPQCEVKACPGGKAALCDPNDVRICEDGSSVRPEGPQCDVKACPDGKKPLGGVTAEPVCLADVFTCPDNTTVARKEPDCGFAQCPGTVCTQEVKTCSDGSAMPRNPATCEWLDKDCPAQNAGGLPDGTICADGEQQCPDGSIVKPEGPKCEFKACPAPKAADGAMCAEGDQICPDGTVVHIDKATCTFNACPPAKVAGPAPGGGNLIVNIFPPPENVVLITQPPTTTIIIKEITKIIETPQKSTALTDRDLQRQTRIVRGCLADKACAAKNRDKCVTALKGQRKEFDRRMLSGKQQRRIALIKNQQKSGRIKVGTDCGCGAGKTSIWASKASDKDILKHLTAAPAQKLPKCYPRKQLIADAGPALAMKSVRDALPSVAVHTIRFGFNQSVIRQEEMINLDRLGRWMEVILAGHPGEIFAIEGHTDLVGTDAFNLKLSKARAVAVKNALVKYYNVPPHSLTTAGFGERFPIVKTQKPEKKNRRIVIRRMTPLVCAQAAAATGPAKTTPAGSLATAAEIKAKLAGNTVKGRMLKGGPYAEFLAQNGNVLGKDYSGNWTLEGDQMCFAYGTDPKECYGLRINGNQVTWLKSGKEAGSGTIVTGNPNKF